MHLWLEKQARIIIQTGKNISKEFNNPDWKTITNLVPKELLVICN